MTSVMCERCGKARPVFNRLCAECFDAELPDDQRVTRARSLAMPPRSLLSPAERAARRGE